MSARFLVLIAFALPLSAAALAQGALDAQDAGGRVTVLSLLKEMTDFEALAVRPRPFFKQAEATSFDRASLEGGEAWFANKDVGQYVRTETNGGRTEHVLADLKGPGAVGRFWSANPTLANVVRFYFDGEEKPRLERPLTDFFGGQWALFPPEFSYVSGTGGNLYFPLPYASSLKITIEETDKPVRLYYEIGYRTYEPGAAVDTFDPLLASVWQEAAAETGRLLMNPAAAPAPEGAAWRTYRLTVPPGKTGALPEERGEMAVYEWSARVLGTRESRTWDDPQRAHNAYRFLLLGISFDGAESVRCPLGDFFGSGPGVSPYENLFFTVGADGAMTSRLLMPFKSSMRLSLTNAGKIPYTVELKLRTGRRPFDERSYHLRAQWGSVERESWPFFDVNFLETTGEGKVVGTVYEIANPVLIWWGEGDRKVRVDGEETPSTFGTGTEDDYGFAYGHNGPFTRPYHAQTRVDGPWSGGHISLNRWYVLDALPYAAGVRYDEEMWHWMPCRPTWGHVIYWYAKPGAPGPRAIERGGLVPRDLGVREDMIEPFEAEALEHEETGGTAAKERLANCSGAEHLVWRGAKPGDRMTVHFTAPKAGRYSIELNLCQSPEYGRQRIYVNGKEAGMAAGGGGGSAAGSGAAGGAASGGIDGGVTASGGSGGGIVSGGIDGGIVDCWSEKLYWLHAKLGVFDLKEGDNTLVVETLEPNPKAAPGNLFGLDYIFIIGVGPAAS